MTTAEQIAKLKELGFKEEYLEEENITKYSLYKKYDSDRFGYRLDYYDDDNMIYITGVFSSNLKNVPYSELIQNFNNLSSGINAFVKELKDFGFDFYDGKK